MPIFPHISEVR